MSEVATDIEEPDNVTNDGALVPPLVFNSYVIPVKHIASV